MIIGVAEEKSFSLHFNLFEMKCEKLGVRVDYKEYIVKK